MRKVNHFFGMMCMAALLVVGASSCNKDNKQPVSSFDFELPAIEGTSPFEGEKAYVDLVANKLKWYEGDQVMVYSIDQDYTNSQTAVYDGEANMSGQTTTHFTGTPLNQGSEGFFVFYPADKASTTITEGNRATFSVGATQAHTTDLYTGTAYAGRIFMDPQGVVAASTCDAQVNATMKHIFGFVTVKVKDTNNSGKKVTSVAITDNNMHLTGSISIKIPQLTESILNGMKTLGQNYKNGSVDAESYATTLNNYLQQIGYESNPEGNTVTLTCPAAEITSAYKYFTIPLRPGALMKGFTVTLTYDDNTTESKAFDAAAKEYIVIPGTYTNIALDLATL